MAINNDKIAAELVGGKPLAYKVYPGGKWVIIAPDGRKITFSAQKVRHIKAALQPDHAASAVKGQREDTQSQKCTGNQSNRLSKSSSQAERCKKSPGKTGRSA